MLYHLKLRLNLLFSKIHNNMDYILEAASSEVLMLFRCRDFLLFI